MRDALSEDKVEDHSEEHAPMAFKILGDKNTLHFDNERAKVGRKWVVFGLFVFLLLQVHH